MAKSLAMKSLLAIFETRVKRGFREIRHLLTLPLIREKFEKNRENEKRLCTECSIRGNFGARGGVSVAESHLSSFQKLLEASTALLYGILIMLQA